MLTVNEQIGKVIRRLRTEKGLTQGEFGKCFNISQNRVTNIETGKSTLTFEELLSMAKYFNVSTDYILKDTGVREENPQLQYITDYIGLKKEAIDKLRKYCVIDVDMIDIVEFDDDKKMELKLDESFIEKDRRIINDFIMSDSFDNIVHSIGKIKYINEKFLSFLALTYNDYDYFSKLQNRDIANDNLEDAIVYFLSEFLHREVNDALRNDVDLNVFLNQKSLLKYYNSISYLTEIDDETLRNCYNSCQNFLCTFYDKRDGELLNSLKRITTEEHFVIKAEKLKPIYDRLKLKQADF